MSLKPDYNTNDPKGWCGDPRRGAALGRSSSHTTSDFSQRIWLRRVYLNQGGYDCNGTYFGIGDPLYWYTSANGEIDAMLRATDREHARAQVLSLYPRAKVRK